MAFRPVFWGLRLLLIILSLRICESIRLRNDMYVDLLDPDICFRRGNGTDVFGCSSDLGGNVGVVMKAGTKSEIDFILKSAIGEPFIVLLTPKAFNVQNINLLAESGKISGIVLLMDEKLDLQTSYSDDASCPNSPTSLYSDNDRNCPAEKPWNDASQDLMFKYFPFPLVLIKTVNDTDYLLKDCYEKYNKPGKDGKPKSYPLCAVEVKGFMKQATNSEICLRRSEKFDLMEVSPSFCDSLGDQSVFKLQTAVPDSSTDQFSNDSVIIVSTRIDTMGLFEKSQIGSQSPATGIVTLLAVSKLIGDVPLNYKSGVENILFAFLHGESFDYIGSSRMVYDFAENKFPCSYMSSKNNFRGNCDKVNKFKVHWPKVRVESVKSYLEIGEMFDPTSDSHTLYAHVDDQFQGSLVDDLINVFPNGKMKESAKKQRGLPPASLQMMLKERREIPGVFVTNFDQQMTNRYYHSIYDNYNMLGVYNYSKGSDQEIVKSLSAVSESLAEFLYFQATGKRTSFKMDHELMNELLNCYISTARCDLFAKSSTSDIPPQTKEPPPPTPYPQYVQVGNYHHQLHPITIQRLLTYLTGEVVDEIVEEDKCVSPEDQSIYWYFFVRGNSTDKDCKVPVNNVRSFIENATVEERKDGKSCGVCMKTTSWLSEARSPAFVIDGYDFSSKKYGAWTESTWDSISARIFMKADPALEKMYLACGIIVTLLSFIFAFWFDNLSDVVFASQSPAEQEPQAAPRSRMGPRAATYVNGEVLASTNMDGVNSDRAEL